MAKLFGSLTYNDSDRIFNQTDGQSIIFDATMMAVERHNADLQNVINLFVDGTTTDHLLRYAMPGFGTSQRMGRLTRPKAVKSGGEWDVAFPLEKFGDQIAWDKETMAYMTMQRYRNHVQTIFNDDVATMRIIILNALLGGVATTYTDPHYGALTVQPLANQDGTLYPPVLGTTSEAQLNHYLVTGYAASAISDINDPIATAVALLESEYGTPTGGTDIWTLTNPTHSAKFRAMADFIPVDDKYIRPGMDTAVLTAGLNIPPNMRLIGRVSGSFILEWRSLPANYLIHLHPMADKPLKMRVHPADTGLSGNLVLEVKEEEYPFMDHIYIRRCGFGVANRLGAAATFLDAGSTWTAPTIT